MVGYQIFVRLLSQFSERNRARIDVDGWELIVQKENGKWILSTTLMQDEELPHELRAMSQLRWQNKGAYLDLSGDRISLKQTIAVPTYLPFKAVLIDFLSQAAEWRSLISTLAEREMVC